MLFICYKLNPMETHCYRHKNFMEAHSQRHKKTRRKMSVTVLFLLKSTSRMNTLTKCCTVHGSLSFFFFILPC